VAEVAGQVACSLPLPFLSTVVLSRVGLCTITRYREGAPTISLLEQTRFSLILGCLRALSLRFPAYISCRSSTGRVLLKGRAAS
jgi:hypothetical protein